MSTPGGGDGLPEPRHGGLPGAGGPPGEVSAPPGTGAPLAALGLDGVPLLEPLAYPGRPVPWPALLLGDRLVRLRAVPGGGWSAPDGTGLEVLLAAAGQPGSARRVPVLAVGSNASPAQMRHKLLTAGLPVCLPMLPATVRGLDAGVSAHVSVAGYVGAAPVTAAGAVAEVVVCWADDAQRAAVDATEPNYRRVELPAAAFPVTLPDGRVPPVTWLYAGRHGVLAPRGVPLRATGQPQLLAGLLERSAALRALLGPGPDDWVRRAAADPLVRRRAAGVFAAEGWVLRQPELERL